MRQLGRAGMALVPAAIVITCVFVLNPPLTAVLRQPAGVGDGRPVDLGAGHIIEQTFRAPAEQVDAVGLVVATGDGSKKGNIVVSVIDAVAEDDNASVVARSQMRIERITDWQNQVFQMPATTLQPGKQYCLRIEAVDGTALAASSDDVYADGSLMDGNTRLAQDLVMRFYQRTSLIDYATSTPAHGIPGYVTLLLLAALLVGTSGAGYALSDPNLRL